MIDFSPNEEQQLIVDTVRQFAVNEVRPVGRECDESGEIPSAVLAQAHELGLVANGFPEAHGGGGERSAVTGVLIAEELAWGDLSVALAILSPALTGFPVADFGTAATQAEVLPKLVGTGFVPGSLALVEPRFDHNAFAPKTTASAEDDGYVISGEKCFVPWLDGGDHVVVTASLDGAARAFVVERNASGLKAERERNMGLQGLATAELRLDGVRVPGDALLAEGAVRDIVTRGRVAQAAVCVGIARSAFEVARDYAKERHAFGVPIASKQAIAFKLADMSIEIDGARLLTWEAAETLDRGVDALREATLAHQQARRVALEVADGAVQVYGGHGYIREYLPELHLRNARGFSAFEALALI
ncbi:MAG: acyl-CoA dehydrogenase family protein [Deltaproteobacteria bacterium]|nr:acyl-CoA dehydrogenase family protein [Deltaproteobacteria bacterium]